MLLDDPERFRNLGCPEVRRAADCLMPASRRKLDHDLAVALPDVNVGRFVLPRRQVYDDAKPINTKDGRHAQNITQLMG